MTSEVDTIWARDEAAQKAPGLTRENVVAAAIGIADAEGLNAVSIRRIATELGARPMSLYSHIERKDYLIDLMVDAVMAGALIAGEVPGDWREALRQIAEHSRAMVRAHPWMIGAALHRPLLGPNALHHIDQSLAAVASLDLPAARKRAALLTVDAYTLGYAAWEVRSTVETTAGQAAAANAKGEAIAAYVADRAKSGDYPYLAEHAGEDLRLDVGRENFEAGLEWLLAGIEAEVAARRANDAE
jgi:AcrR family transcriptional regulator